MRFFNFRRTSLRFFSRKAAISTRCRLVFLKILQTARNSFGIHETSCELSTNIAVSFLTNPATCSISLLFYTCALKLQLERNKCCIKKCNKNCTNITCTVCTGLYGFDLLKMEPKFCHRIWVLRNTWIPLNSLG